MRQSHPSPRDHALRHRAARRGRTHLEGGPVVGGVRQRPAALPQGQWRRGAAADRVPGARRKLGHLHAGHQPAYESTSARTAFRSRTTRCAAAPARRSRSTRPSRPGDGSWHSTRPRCRRPIFSPPAPASSCCIRSRAWSATRSRWSTWTAGWRKSKFPELVNPVQPFLDIRALDARGHSGTEGRPCASKATPGRWRITATGPTRPSRPTCGRCVLPWPYTLKAGERSSNRSVSSLSGSAGTGKGAKSTAHRSQSSAPAGQGTLPPLGLGMPAEEIDARIEAARAAASTRRRASCNATSIRARSTDSTQLYGYRVLCEQTGAECVLEIVVESVDDYRANCSGSPRW